MEDQAVMTKMICCCVLVLGCLVLGSYEQKLRVSSAIHPLQHGGKIKLW